jgi:hypothetical protein
VTASSHAREKREELRDHSREPWAQLGRFVRDANGRIVVRGKTPADIRRIVACVNALSGVPTETVEHWSIQVTGGAGAGPDPSLNDIPEEAVEAIKQLAASEERRMGERRRGERRRAAVPACAEREVHERESSD